MQYRAVIVCAVLCLCSGGGTLAANIINEVEREIAHLKKEISRVEAQRTDEAQQARKEQLDFKKYRERIAERNSSITRQTDSLGAELRKANLHNDSVRALMSAVASRIREQEIQRQRLREAILRAARSIESEIMRYTPLISEQYRGPLTYLTSEIQTGSIDHTEALSRLLRIVGDARVAAQEIQVVETVSPVPQLRGSVYRLRVGGFFEAVVDAKGEKAFIWNPAAENDNDRWIAAAQQEDVASIFTAISIREGKRVPELVRLPFGAPSVLAGEQP